MKYNRISGKHNFHEFGKRRVRVPVGNIDIDIVPLEKTKVRVIMHVRTIETDQVDDYCFDMPTGRNTINFGIEGAYIIGTAIVESETGWTMIVTVDPCNSIMWSWKTFLNKLRKGHGYIKLIMPEKEDLN